ncbi:MAG: copper-binding protein [Gallionella sp.]|nr:copper-binding protein [Gallionella sp.]
MKYATFSSLLLLLLTGSGAVMADELKHGTDHAEIQNMQHADMRATQSHKAEGVLNSIDLQNNKINLTHGPVESLGWPGMTMNFSIKDASILKGIKPDQKVTFEIVKEAAKQFYVSKITPLK